MSDDYEDPHFGALGPPEARKTRRKIECPRCAVLTVLKVEPYHVCVWECPECGDYAECEHDGTKPIGKPVSKDVHAARAIFNNRLFVPMVRMAPHVGGTYQANDARAVAMIQNAARRRIGEYLAHVLGIEGEFEFLDLTLDQLRAAWVALKATDYATIREWSKARDAAEDDRHGVLK